MTSPAIRRAVHCPITALAFFARGKEGGDDEVERYVLVGEDTQLKVYEVQSGRLRLEVQVFRGQAIHGIRVSADNLLVWGARCVAVALIRSLEDVLAAGPSAGGVVRFEVGEARDWIHDGVLDQGRDSGVLVTLHNEVVEISWAEGRGLSFGDVLSPSRPMLYTASVRLLADGRVLVAGGTVFGEILIWTCRRGGEGKGRCRVRHVLAGHDGSIFGVDISDEIEVGAGRTLRLLASCSDDRTVRVWDISDTASEGEEKEGGDESLLHEARETGFGYNEIGSSGEGTVPEEPIAVAMGHMSRIWHARFAPLPPGRPASSTIPIYSFGEDSTAHSWDLELRNFKGLGGTSSEVTGARASPAISATLTHQTTFSNHDGKHIWSSAISSRDNGTILVATGGADGKVALIEEGQPVLDVGRSDIRDGGAPFSTMVDHETLALLDAPVKEGKNAKNRNDHLRRYVFIGEDTLLSATQSGKLLIGSFGRGSYVVGGVDRRWISR
ncbi:uncharacterized protein DNG_04987 [Cephalotrichum gorgonifer]|uniref:WD40 domain-containing protein n=1 Tax=Cephalotrichum gorgonifer TaxID=2041049 RepID=A0AAE8MYY4_9PEZI|nr:uncharacterized protein DNG_04987 [Cephalotrichum gorgonifer]